MEFNLEAVAAWDRAKTAYKAAREAAQEAARADIEGGADPKLVAKVYSLREASLAE